MGSTRWQARSPRLARMTTKPNKMARQEIFPQQARLSFSESSGPDSHRQKRPPLRQQFLNCLPDPHGQRSLRPNFSASSFSP
jgi:hypothetical protein